MTTTEYIIDYYRPIQTIIGYSVISKLQELGKKKWQPRGMRKASWGHGSHSGNVEWQELEGPLEEGREGDSNGRGECR